MLPIAQIASVVGVYGLSALVALGERGGGVCDGRAARSAALARLRAGRARSCCGRRRVGHAADPRPCADQRRAPVRVAVLQGNILQDQKWDPAMRDAIMQRYIDMTREAIGRNAQFILWPESATPLPYEQDVARGELIRRLAREAHVTLLIGSDQVEPVQPVPAAKPPPSALYNAAYLIRPDGSTAAVYRKIHLVPVRRVRAVQPAAVFRRHRWSRPSRTSRPAPRRRCCRSPGTWPAPRSATR